MTGDEEKYITPDQAALRLGKSPSQVRRDAQSHRVNSMRDGGRIWIRVDDRFKALEQDPSLQFPEDLVAHEPEEAPSATKSERVNRCSGSANLTEELIDEVADLRAEVAHLTARVRKLESRS